MKKILVLFIQVIFSLVVDAYPKINGIYYNFNTTNKTASVTYLSNYPRDNAKAYTGDVVIPEEVEYDGETYSVISISERAFTTCSGLTSVIIPNSITSIGDYAFSGCHGLKKVSIPNTVSSIGINAFSACLTLETINIPNSLTTIKSETFNQCTCITSIVIPNSVKYIEEKAFYGCSGLTSIEIPSSVVNIEQNAFLGCYNMETVTINSNYILSKNYESQKAFKSIFGSQVINYILGDAVKVIGDYVFQNCSNLTSITIPNSVVRIGKNIFEGCTGLTNISIPDGITFIGNSAFENCSGLTFVSIPNSVKGIGSEVFKGCDNLASIIIPENVTKINSGTFSGCFRLTSVTIPKSVTVIGAYAFFECKELASIEIPDAISTIENSTFSGCTSLTSVVIPSSVKSIGWAAFSNCTKLKTIIIPNSVTTMESWAFSGCTSLESIVVPNTLTLIPYSAFYNCKSLSNIELPNKLENIEQNAFEGCENLTSIVFPSSVKKIGWKAFNGTSITKATFMHSKEYLDKLNWSSSDASDFKGPTGTKLIFSDDVKAKVGRNYFRYRSDAFKYWMDENPACFDGIDREGYAEGTFVKVTDGDRYQWISISGTLDGKKFTPSSFCIDRNTGGEMDLGKINSYSNGMGTSYSIENISFEAFRGCGNITDVKIPETVKSLGGSSFRETGLRHVVVPNSVTTLGMDVFRKCKHLKTVVLGNSVESLDEAVFNFDDSLEIVVSLAKTPPLLDKSTFGSTHGFDHDMTLKGHPYAIIVHNDALTAYQNAEYWKDLINFQTFESTPVYLIADTLNLKGSSARILFYPVDEAHKYGEIPNGEELVINGLEPETSVSGMKLDWITKDGNFGTAILDVATSAFSIETKDAKALSTSKARLIASTDGYDDMTHYGFEWKRYDAPEDLPANKVSAPLYNGQIVGTLNKLKDDVYYKYRPFYTSDSGKTYYGEWKTFFTGDADVYFEPEVYTKDAADITKVSALLAGVWFEGTDDIEEKGFEYWTVSNNKTRTAGSDAKKVIVSGNSNMMTTILEGLKAGTGYGYRSYARTASGTTYGEEKTFRTILVGDVNSDGVLDEKDLKDLADYIMGKTPKGFNKKEADLNNDNKVNAADIVKLVDLLGK